MLYYGSSQTKSASVFKTNFWVFAKRAAMPRTAFCKKGSAQVFAKGFAENCDADDDDYATTSITYIYIYIFIYLFVYVYIYGYRLLRVPAFIAPERGCRDEVGLKECPR